MRTVPEGNSNKKPNTPAAFPFLTQCSTLAYNSSMVDSSGQTGATNLLLETKLYVPRWRPSLVRRAWLMERLDRGAERKLTLVSAPAGFGKTTVLVEWLATAPPGKWLAAWVSLDQGDNDPALFWAYLVAALQTIQPGVGESTLSLCYCIRHSLYRSRRC